MRPLHASNLPAIVAAAGRHYLRPVSLTPDPVTPDRWSITVDGRETRTEILKTEERYTFQTVEKPKP